MSKYTGRWTDSDNIKAHLQSSEIEFPTVSDQELILPNLDGAQLTNNNITDNSEVVKNQITLTPTQTTALLVGTVPALITPYLIPTLIVVASDLAMTVIYQEDNDYVIDYVTGTVERASVGSTIVSGATVFVWYIAFNVLIRNTDYAINYDAGTIERIAGTSIPNGAKVFVDYSHSQSTVTDDLIKRAIQEAEEFMADRLSSVSIVDEGLTTTANYYALAIIALSQAVKELKSRSNNSDNLSKVWNTLSETYTSRAMTAFKKFTTSADLNPGGVFQNRYSRERSTSRTSPSISTSYRKR